MDHKQLIAGLSAAERAALTTRINRPGLVRLALHLGLIITGGWIIGTGMSGWQALLLVQGILLVFLFTLLHETVHQTPFRSYWLNVLAGRLCSMVLLLPYNWFRYFHFALHRFTQDLGNDPELASPQPVTRLQYVWYVCGAPVWWSHLKALLTNAAGRNADEFVPARGQARVKREAQTMLAGYMLLALGSWLAGSAVLFWVWMVPLLLGQPFLRLYLLAEHGRCALVGNMLENSRTTFTNALVRFVAWNMPYHAEHHSYPAVPFHKLPDFHKLAREHLRQTAPGYSRFTSDYVSGLED